MAWALGSAIPLAGIAATPLVRTGPLPPVIAMSYLAVVGLAVGLAMTATMARSVADPLSAVIDATSAPRRRGMR